MSDKSRIIIIITGLTLLLGIFIGVYFLLSPDTPSNPEFEIRVLSTRDSDAIIVRAGGKNILIDGAYREYSYRILGALEDMEITHLDYIIITHFDSDHIGGLPEVMRVIPVTTVLAPRYSETSGSYRRLNDALTRANLTMTRLAQDYIIELDGGHIWVNTHLREEYDDENNFSLITAIHYGDYSALFMGDSLRIRTNEFLTALAERPARYQSFNFAKLPHHGQQNNGPLRSLLRDSGVQYTVVTHDNPDRVSSALLNFLAGENASVYFTWDGDVRVIIENGRLVVKQ